MNVFTSLMEPMQDRPCIARSEPKREITPKPRPTPRAIPASPWKLTELQLLMQELSAQGLSRKEIGAQMGISIKTIDVHLRLGKKKMGARNNVHAAVLFDRWKRNQHDRIRPHHRHASPHRARRLHRQRCSVRLRSRARRAVAASCG